MTGFFCNSVQCCADCNVALYVKQPINIDEYVGVFSRHTKGNQLSQVGVIENTAAKYFISLFTVVFSFPVLMLAMEEPTASGVFCNRMLSMVNSEDVNAIIQAQRHM